jgi:hypothetical protein
MPHVADRQLGRIVPRLEDRVVELVDLPAA